MEEEKRFLDLASDGNSEGAISCESKTGASGHGNNVRENGELELQNGEGPKVVFSMEGPLVARDLVAKSTRNTKKPDYETDSGRTKREKLGQERKLNRQDRIELCRLFQGAVSSHDWELAESLIMLADQQTLNDSLCIALDSIWFLSTPQELDGVMALIKMIIANGAYDFTRAAMRTSFLASCVSACQRPGMSLADTVSVMAERYQLS